MRIRVERIISETNKTLHHFLAIIRNVIAKGSIMAAKSPKLPLEPMVLNVAALVKLKGRINI
jgi:hypothetical protein